MKIHEYQAKELFRKFNIPVPKGLPAFSKDEALQAAEQIGFPCVVKAQIHAGGRGKGGGVKVAQNLPEAEKVISKIFNRPLITHQTGSEGKVVHRLLIEEALEIEREIYLSVLVDREKARPVIIASTAGGMEIEKVAKENPDKIIMEYALPGIGFQDYQFRRLAFALDLREELFKQGLSLFTKIVKAFFSTDASLIEVNPLIITRDKRLIALDAKINFDDNALSRHPDFLELRDLEEEEPSEVEASNYKLNYIRLSGNVGCMVNGAGLAMATMDIIKLYGGEPANFLDVGGIASSETVSNGFKIILSDSNVKAILVNIFGGIVRCDRVAQGVVDAYRTLKKRLPLIIRLEGTNAEVARQILADSSLDFIIAENFAEAAQKAVTASKSGGLSI